MFRKEKIALLSAIVYIFIMGLGMTILPFLGLTYNNPEMVKVIVFAELVMSVLSIYVYKYLNLNILSKSFEFTKWLLPFVLILILIIIFSINTADFNNDFPLILLIGITTLLVGFSEEVMFRGIVLNTLIEKRSTLFSIIFSSILFSSLHIVNIFGGLDLIGVPLQLLSTFLFGLIFSCLSLLIKNIIPLILYHFIWDFIIVSEPLTHIRIWEITTLSLISQILIVVPLIIYTINYVKETKLIK